MSERSFQMRLDCRYAAPDNSIAELSVEQFLDGAWQPFDLSVRSPGFQVFVYAILTCQHMYFRANCAERGLNLTSAKGTVEVLTDEDWVLRRLRVAFTGRLRSGTPSEPVIQYIAGRMGQCPVSINLKAVPETSIRVDFA
jgi:uncharacterized OsmC-like protein